MTRVWHLTVSWRVAFLKNAKKSVQIRPEVLSLQESYLSHYSKSNQISNSTKKTKPTHQHKERTNLQDWELGRRDCCTRLVGQLRNMRLMRLSRLRRVTQQLERQDLFSAIGHKTQDLRRTHWWENSFLLPLRISLVRTLHFASLQKLWKMINPVAITNLWRSMSPKKLLRSLKLIWEKLNLTNEPKSVMP